MAVRFTVMASGSAGNASLLQAGDFGVLVDFGLGVRGLAGRLAARGLSWQDAHVALLTHTHGDHWCETALAALVKRGVPLFCHRTHTEQLSEWSEAFRALMAAGLVRRYEPGEWFDLGGQVAALPVPVSHDCSPTFAFRFEGPHLLYGAEWSLGYAADLGTWDDGVARALADVDLLALEFNHDEHLQRTSGRPWQLIQRVLGDHGHLSNRQAAELLLAVRRHSRYAHPRTVVPLHISRQCNTPELALAAAIPAAGEHALVIASCQHAATETIAVGRSAAPVPRRTRRPATAFTEAPSLFWS